MDLRKTAKSGWFTISQSGDKTFPSLLAYGIIRRVKESVEICYLLLAPTNCGLKESSRWVSTK